MSKEALTKHEHADWCNYKHGRCECGAADQKQPIQDQPEPREWLIRKRGYYYRPNRAGYTASVAEAGRYTKAEAENEAALEPWHMTAVHESAVSEPRLPTSKKRDIAQELRLANARGVHPPQDWTTRAIEEIDHLRVALLWISQANSALYGYDSLRLKAQQALSADPSPPETTAQPLYPQIILDRLRQIANLIDSRPVMGHWPAMMTQPDADFLRSLADALKERKTHPLLAESSEETSRGGPIPDALKAPVISDQPCPTGDWVHEERNGKCVYCGAPMPAEKAEPDELNQLASAFYKRVAYRVPGLIDQIQDVAKPLRVALGMDEAGAPQASVTSHWCGDPGCSDQ